MKKIWQLKLEYWRSLKVAWFLALRQIRRSSKGTTGLIIFIMILTYLNLVVVYGLLVGLISGSFKQFREGYSGEVIITATEGKNFIENSQNLVGFLKTHPKVQNFSTRYGASVQILGTLDELPKKDERANQIGGFLVGFNPETEEKITRFSRFIVQGQNLQNDETGYILLGANFVKQYSAWADANIPGLDLLENVDVGSKVRVTLASNSEDIISKDFIIKGIVKSKIDEISTRFFITDKELRSLLPANKDQYQEIAIKTDYAFAPTLVDEIKRFMNGYDARVQTTDEAIPSFLRDIETTMTIMGNALASIALVVASITIFIVIFINAITKRKFIGIMKGVGINPKAIEMAYVFQALFYGLAGSTIGLILTFGFLKPYFEAYPIDFPFSDGILIVTPEGAFIRIAILMVVTLVAGFLPAKLIVSKNTLDSILGR